MRQAKLIFMWGFVGFLIGKGQLVFFTRRACLMPCVYRLGRQNCSKSFAKDFYSTCTNFFAQEEFSDTCFQIQKDLHSNKL